MSADRFDAIATDAIGPLLLALGLLVLIASLVTRHDR